MISVHKRITSLKQHTDYRDSEKNQIH